MGDRTHGGWKLRLPRGRGRQTYLVRFRHAGRRYEKSTGRTDPREAAVEAAKIYADVVSGRRSARANVATDLATAFASFLADYELNHADGTVTSVTLYVRAHLLPFFASFDRFTLASYGDYMRERIQQVPRTTLRKELSALRMFVAWCAEHDTVLPSVPPLPKSGHPGVRHKQARKHASTAWSPATVKRLLIAVPEKSRAGAFVHAFFTLLWETGLRESTVRKLRSPDHYKPGDARLFISRDIDKARFERHIPLTTEAREALDGVCPKKPEMDERGRGQLLFPNVAPSLRGTIEAAAKVAGIGGAISAYDLRHSRASQLANAGAPLAGVAHILGHRHVSTTAIYVKSSDAAALVALEAVTPPKPPVGGHSGGHEAKSEGTEEPTK